MNWYHLLLLQIYSGEVVNVLALTVFPKLKLHVYGVIFYLKVTIY